LHTFQMYEQDDLVDAILVENSARRKRQKKLDIRVIIGNPPYSAGQDNANDNNANVTYPELDSKIRATYAAKSNATLKNSLYDSYIRAIKYPLELLLRVITVSLETQNIFSKLPKLEIFS